MALNQCDNYTRVEKSPINLSSYVLFFLVDAFQSHRGFRKFFSGVWLSMLGCSTCSSNESPTHRQLNFSVDDQSLCREDAEIVMGRLGIFCSPEGEGLKGRMSSNELTGLFDDKEPSLEEVKEAFDVFDENKDGFIDARDLQRVLCALGLKEGSNLENCKKMIKAFDRNSDGRIDFNEFLRFMENSLC